MQHTKPRPISPHAHSKSPGATARQRLLQNGSDVGRDDEKVAEKLRAGLRAALVSGRNCCGNMLAELGLIGTIDENDEVPLEPESDSGDEEEEV